MGEHTVAIKLLKMSLERQKLRDLKKVTGRHSHH